MVVPLALHIGALPGLIPPARRAFAGVAIYVFLLVLLPIPVQEVPVHTIPLAIAYGEPLFTLGVCRKAWTTDLFRNQQLLPF